MENLYTQTTYVDRTKGHIYGESPFQDTGTADIAELYKALVAEYGRCTGKMYIDGEDGTARQVGWVFEKRMPYDDADEQYLREVWVHVYTGKPKVQVTSFDFARGKRQASHARGQQEGR